MLSPTSASTSAGKTSSTKSGQAPASSSAPSIGGQTAGGYAAQRTALAPANQGYAVQLQALRPSSEGGSVQQAAARGVEGGGGALPHLEAVQRSFGAHDVSGVRAHQGGPAADACRSIGASAYATNGAVAFSQAPSLHTAAHEAAHVVQQRGGVQLEGGVGEVGDVYEQHADEVADLVVQGRSAEALLSRYSGGTGPANDAAVQRRVGPAGAVTFDADTGKANAGPSFVFSIPRTFFAPPTFIPVTTAAGGLYGAFEAMARFGWDVGDNIGPGKSAGFRVFGQGRADFNVAAGVSISSVSQATAEIFGGVSATITPQLSMDTKTGFDLSAPVVASLLVGGRVGPFKVQWELGTIDLFTLLVKGSIGNPEAAAPIQAEGAVVPSLGDMQVTEWDCELGPELAAVMNVIKGTIDELLEILGTLQEGAYDVFAAGGTLMGIEDPREVRERINKEIDGMNQRSGEAAVIEKEWLGKGAHASAAANVARAWKNKNQPNADHEYWTGKLERIEEQTDYLIGFAKRRSAYYYEQLIGADLPQKEAEYVRNLYIDAFGFPGFYVDRVIDGGKGADQPHPTRGEHLEKVAKKAFDAAMARSLQADDQADDMEADAEPSLED